MMTEACNSDSSPMDTRAHLDAFGFMTTGAPVVHVGLPKTGTTTLQAAVFGSFEHLLNAGKPNNLASRRDGSVTFDGRMIDALVWGTDTQSSEAQVHLRELSITAFERGQTLVISDERLGYVNVPLSLHERLGSRLAAALPEATVLIGIREQFSLLRSIYLQSDRMMYSALGWSRDVPKRFLRWRLPFADWVSAVMDDRSRTIGGVLAYDELLRSYTRSFPSSQVLLLPVEALPLGQIETVAALVAVSADEFRLRCSTRSNQSEMKMSSHRFGWFPQKLLEPEGFLRSHVSEPLWRGYAHIGLKVFSKIGPVDTSLPFDTSERLRREFSRSNSLVESSTGLPLSRLGYLFQSKPDGLQG